MCIKQAFLFKLFYKPTNNVYSFILLSINIKLQGIEYSHLSGCPSQMLLTLPSVRLLDLSIPRQFLSVRACPVFFYP